MKSGSVSMKIRIVLKSGYAIDVEVDDCRYRDSDGIWVGGCEFDNPRPHVDVKSEEIAAIIQFEDDAKEKHPFGFDNLLNS